MLEQFKQLVKSSIFDELPSNTAPNKLEESKETGLL